MSIGCDENSKLEISSARLPDDALGRSLASTLCAQSHMVDVGGHAAGAKPRLMPAVQQRECGGGESPADLAKWGNGLSTV